MKTPEDISELSFEKLETPSTAVPDKPRLVVTQEEEGAFTQIAQTGGNVFSWFGNKVKTTYQKAVSSIPCKCSPEVEELGCCERASVWL